jgi:parvulin-like peptidyl-prolyl isomerase
MMLDKKVVGISTGAFFGAFAAVLTLGSLNGCSHSGDTIAIVNGERISLNEFYKFLENKPDATVLTQNGNARLPVDGSLGFQALRDVIGHQIELQLARDQGLYPSNAEVDAELALRKKVDPNFLIGNMQKGLTLDMIRKSMTLDLAQEKLLTRGITVTTQDATTYFTTHPKEFMEPARADVSVIFVKKQSSEPNVDQELASGQSFTDVAEKSSESPSARKFKGKLTDPDQEPPAISSLPQEVQDAIAGVPEQSQTRWVQFSNGYAKFHVDRRIPAKPAVMDDNKMEMLRRALAKQKGAATRDVQKMILDKLRSSKVEILQEEYKPEWKSAFEEFKAQG